MAPVSLGALVDGWFSGARAVPSPNQDERLHGVSIDLLVIHAISLPPDVFGDDVERLFTNTLTAIPIRSTTACETGVSATVYSSQR